MTELLSKRKITMSSAKARMVEVIEQQPEDATYEEIMRELAFERMVANGLEDSRAGRVISNDDMRSRIRAWRR
jgi:predicted transcriptional regulator